MDACEKAVHQLVLPRWTCVSYSACLTSWELTLANASGLQHLGDPEDVVYREEAPANSPPRRNQRPGPVEVPRPGRHRPRHLSHACISTRTAP